MNAVCTRKVGKGVWEATVRLGQSGACLVAYGRSERKALSALRKLRGVS